MELGPGPAWRWIMCKIQPACPGRLSGLTSEDFPWTVFPVGNGRPGAGEHQCPGRLRTGGRGACLQSQGPPGAGGTERRAATHGGRQADKGTGGPRQSPHAPRVGAVRAGLSVFLPRVLPGLTQKGLQKRLLMDSRVDPHPLPAPHTCACPGVPGRGNGALPQDMQGDRALPTGPLMRCAIAALGSETLSSKGLPGPQGHPGPRRAGGRENSAQSGNGRHLTPT